MAIEVFTGPQIGFEDNPKLPTCRIAPVVEHLLDVTEPRPYSFQVQVWVSGNDDTATCQ